MVEEFVERSFTDETLSRKARVIFDQPCGRIRLFKGERASLRGSPIISRRRKELVSCLISSPIGIEKGKPFDPAAAGTSIPASLPGF